MRSASFILIVVTATSVGAYLFATRRLGLAPSSLRIATLRTTEILGTVLLFFMVDLAVGIAAILALRATTGWFLSVYLLNDLSLPLLSGLQALLFDSWRGWASGHDPNTGNESCHVLDAAGHAHGGAIHTVPSERLKPS